MGYMGVPLYPNSGIMWENQGGTVLFKGRCVIGNNSALSIGPLVVLEIVDDTTVSSSLKLVCHSSVVFEKRVRIGWDCVVMDTAFHRLRRMDGFCHNEGDAPVHIAENNWIAARNLILPGTRTAGYCTFAAGSVLHKDYRVYPTHSLFAGNPLSVKVQGVYRDMDEASVKCKKNNL
ncbi:MAG: hypothetical protein LUE31_11650 [Lachnospiraceae bacterium]|nr:hypothetical protein [Lachnospiraceae bacterium]